MTSELSGLEIAQDATSLCHTIRKRPLCCDIQVHNLFEMRMTFPKPAVCLDTLNTQAAHSQASKLMPHQLLANLHELPYVLWAGGV